MIERRYLEHLSDSDLALLAESGPEGWGWKELRSRPETLLATLGRQEVFERVFGQGEYAILGVSPFLTFAVLVHRAEAELESMTHVQEWVGPRQRLPVFGARELTGFLAEPAFKLFLAELLASYVHVASGSVVVRYRRGWRRQRFSELDPVRLASLLEVVGDAERPGLYRRLGDLALFLTGVFPDRSATRAFSEIESSRLLRTARRERPRVGEQTEPLSFLETLGKHWYGLAYATASYGRTLELEIVAGVAKRFSSARRVLNFVTDRHLFTVRSRWFGGAQ